MYVNASDENNVDTVRDKIKNFASTIGFSQWKLIILDEADAITLDAQSALRKVIETSSKITRFCFTCNYIEKIIQPIISRCVKFRFKPLSINLLSERLGKIAELEKIYIRNEAIKKICEISGGDGRKAIMILQNCKYIIKKNNDKYINIEDCDEITGTTNEKLLEEIYTKLNKSSIYEMNDLAYYIINNNININNLLKFIKNKIINSNNISVNNNSLRFLDASLLIKKITLVLLLDSQRILFFLQYHIFA